MRWEKKGGWGGRREEQTNQMKKSFTSRMRIVRRAIAFALYILNIIKLYRRSSSCEQRLALQPVNLRLFLRFSFPLPFFRNTFVSPPMLVS